jgi:DNA modification methylase
MSKTDSKQNCSAAGCRIINADCREGLKDVPDASVQCVVTSPPYWGLRSYLKAGHPDKWREIGQEKSPQEYVETMRTVFRELWRVLKDDGTVWLNLGDSYASNGGHSDKHCNDRRGQLNISNRPEHEYREFRAGSGLKPKDLIGIPWRVALALQADGWWLRSDIIWAKPNCMPESVTDRPTRSHEYIFLLTKSARYFYDADAIKEPCSEEVMSENRPHGIVRDRIYDYDSKEKILRPHTKRGTEKQRGHSRRHDGFNDRWDAMEKTEQCSGMRNKRDVWTVSPAQYPDSHFATFPPDLIKPCIRAGSRPGDTVLDPFGGSGTVGEVALSEGRSAILIELNADYIPLIETRTNVTAGLPLNS